jgi:hypothetical protein
LRQPRRRPPPGHPTKRFQCAISIEASNRFTSSRSRVGWRKLTDRDRRSLTITSRRHRPALWCTRTQLLPNGAPTSGSLMLTITGRCCR